MVSPGSYSLDLRPRFLPDAQVRAEWGIEPAFLHRLILRGFRVPPIAAWGKTQIQSWLESLPAYRPAIEAWRIWNNPEDPQYDPAPPAMAHLADLRDQILATPMPMHFAASVRTIREMLCGGQVWPLQLRLGARDRSWVIQRPDLPFEVWRALREVLALQFTLDRAIERLSDLADPRGLRFSVLVQPVLGESQEPLTPESKRELFTQQALAKTMDPDALLEWLWDGQQIWFTGVEFRQRKTLPQTFEGPVMGASILARFLIFAQQDLKTRFKLHVEGLERAFVWSEAVGWRIQTQTLRVRGLKNLRNGARVAVAAVRLAMGTSDGQAFDIAKSEFRLARRLGWGRQALTPLVCEVRDLHDREVRELKSWVARLPLKRDPATLEKRFDEAFRAAREILTRSLAALILRDRLGEALAFPNEARFDAKGRLSRLRSEGEELHDRLSEIVALSGPLFEEFELSLRQLVNEGGEYLVKKGFLKSREDVNLLAWEEMLRAIHPDALTVRFLVEKRRMRFNVEEQPTVASLPQGLVRRSGGSAVVLSDASGFSGVRN